MRVDIMWFGIEIGDLLQAQRVAGRRLHVAFVAGDYDPMAALDDEGLSERTLRKHISDAGVRVTVEDPESAPHYIAVVIRGVKVGPSPV